MADSKITALTALTTADPANDMIPIVDVSDTPPASGNTKRISINNILACSPSATLASATISGDLTVDTSTLKVDSTNNRVGIGTASPLYALDVRGTIAGGNGTIFGGVTFSSRTEIGALSNHDVGIIANSVTQYLISTGGNHTWFNGGSTAMTLNSTGLGVGTAPSYNIDVLGATLPTIAVRATSAGASNARIYLECAGTNSGHITYNRSLQALTLGATGGTTSQVTLDSAGNVGISVTPSAWTSSVRAIDIVSGGLGVFSGGITHNAYFDNTDSRWEYKTNGSATYYNLQTGIHQWFVAASGTANNPITTFATAAMNLDASGNLGVGITNPSFRLHALVSSGADRDIFAAQVLAASNGLQVKWNHATTTLRIILANIPTSSAGLATGTLWNDAGTIKIA
jgi:hypothetical protein